MYKSRLTAKARKFIEDMVDDLFDRLKARLLGPGGKKMFGRKALVLRYNSENTLSGLFEASVKQEGVTPNDELLAGLLKIAASYLDASREKTKAHLIHSVQSFLSDAQSKGVKTDLKTVLGGQLIDVLAQAERDVRRIVETESTTVRNMGIHDAIGRVAAATGSKDPSVFWVVVRDNTLCETCKGLHLQSDGITPRVWKMSEVSSGYFKKGQKTPCVAGPHPNCRCVMSHLMPGYGFDKTGRVTYIEPGHDEYAAQREKE